MSGHMHRKGLLQTTAALTAAGAVAVAPVLPVVPALAQESQVVSGPLEVRIGTNRDYTRVEFAGVIGQRAQVRRDGQAVIIRVGSTAAPDVSQLKVNPPPGVASVETRAVRGGSEVVLNLAEGGEARSGSSDGAVWINLYGPGMAPAQAAEPTTQTAPTSVVPVVARATESTLELSFAWNAPVAAAVFRRGDAVWVVFDGLGKLDMAGAKALGPAKDIKWAAGADYVAVRVAAPEALGVTAQAEGGLWTVRLGGSAVAAGGVSLARDEESGPTALVAQMAGATKTIWLTDPMVGDRFAAVTAMAPSKGFAGRRKLVDLTLLPTAQGLAIEGAADDLTVTAEGDLVRIARPRGLTLSAPSAELEAAAEASDAPRKGPYPAVIMEPWAATGEAGFADRRKRLLAAAVSEAEKAADDPRAPAEARLAYARFLVASDLNYEAIGVLNAIVAKTPGMLGEAEVRGLRGAARTAIGRYEEAAADFSAAVIQGDPSSRAWQGYIDAQRGDWVAARQAFADAAPSIDLFPKVWRARFAVAHAQAAIETGDLTAARSLLNYAFTQDPTPEEQLKGRLIQARMFELDGETDRALAVYKAIGRAPLDGISVPALLGAVKLELAKGAIKPADAIPRLESLRWRWRGDATEVSVTRTLGNLYLSQGQYREALNTFRGMGKRLPTTPEAVALQNDLSNAFRALFLEGAADGMQPVQALALFYDFRDLTPVGADGDEMVRRLARRLVDVDLLDQAAELLKHQVDARLEGVAKAQVATDLAMIYLMDRQPEAALQAIWNSRTTLLPSAMNAERRALEARALMELGRYDHALEVLGSDRSDAAEDVRADVYWKQKNWAAAGAIYERLLGDRWKTRDTALTPDQESRLIRAGVGYSLAHDGAGVNRLYERYGSFIAGAKQAPALRIALAGLDYTPGDVAAASAAADTFAGWVAQMKTALRNKTGAKSASAPAPAQTAQPAAPARAAGG